MSKVRPVEVVASMSGKVCTHSKMYFRTNSFNGSVSTGKMCNPYKGEPSADQVAAKARFKAVTIAVRARIAAMTDAEKAKLKAAAKAAQAGSTFGYAMHKWNDEYDATGTVITPDPEEGE